MSKGGPLDRRSFRRIPTSPPHGRGTMCQSALAGRRWALLRNDPEPLCGSIFAKWHCALREAAARGAQLSLSGL
eukprot:9848749-Alexandrium_andersonii.AAC.1